MAEDEVGWGLVMPFVVCQSKGGPYEDEAFVAGFACGGIYFLLGLTTDNVRKVDEPIKRAYLPQIDLIAMRFGFTIDVEGDDPDWCQVTFRRQEADQT